MAKKKAAKHTTRRRKPAGATGTATLERGTGSLDVTLIPSVANMQPRVIGPGSKKKQRIRLQAGYVYPLPPGTRFWPKPKPSGIAQHDNPNGTPVDLDELSPDRVRDHRLHTRLPLVAKAEAFVAEKLGVAHAKQLLRQGADVLVKHYNALVQRASEKIKLPPDTPDLPVGVRPMSQELHDQLETAEKNAADAFLRRFRGGEHQTTSAAWDEGAAMERAGFGSPQKDDEEDLDLV